MKNVFYIGILIVICVIVAVLISKHNPKPVIPSNFSVIDGTYCYGRVQDATEALPYSVEEHISITLLGNSVSGKKSGTQAGPDMANGYTGTLTGIMHENILELVYAYTIEGSTNKELEVYDIAEGTLTKNRWPLVEGGEMLVPDQVSEPTLLTYIQEEC